MQQSFLPNQTYQNNFIQNSLQAAPIAVLDSMMAVRGTYQKPYDEKISNKQKEEMNQKTEE